MATYRAYFLDRDKHIQKREEFEAASDDEALAKARQWADGYLVEVWQEHLLVGAVAPKQRRSV